MGLWLVKPSGDRWNLGRRVAVDIGGAGLADWGMLW
jgi:hypothetical protein